MSGLYLKGSDKVPRSIVFFAFGCIIGTFLHLFTCTHSSWLITDNKIIGNENGMPLR